MKREMDKDEANKYVDVARDKMEKISCGNVKDFYKGSVSITMVGKNVAQLTKEEEDKLIEIRKRWDGSRNKYCPDCMYEVIRHGDRNMDPSCTYDGDPEGYDSTKHPGRYDGDIIAYAPEDIWALIGMVERLGIFGDKT
jgi:hypothetical protein